MRIQTRGHLANLLGVKSYRLTYFAYVLGDEQKYRSFQIPKRNGQPRYIVRPNKGLLEIQKGIKNILDQYYDNIIPVGNHGYVKSRGIKTAVVNHVGKGTVIKLDLKDFFGSINERRIYGFLLKPPFEFSKEVAHLIARLCTYKGYLAQGSPTSPVISNLICRRMDKALLSFATKHRGSYTRYSDDITFSFSNAKSVKAFHAQDGEKRLPSESLLSIIKREGFEFNEDKFFVLPQHTRQRVLGCVLNVKPNLPKEYIKDLRAFIYISAKYGFDESTNRYNHKHGTAFEKEELIRVIMGRLNHLASIRGREDALFIRLASRLAEIYPRYSYTTLSLKDEHCDAILVCEGKTDYIHLSSVLKYFKTRMKFNNLKLKIEDIFNISGADGVDKHVESLSKSPPNIRHIAIFDSDIETIVTKYGSSEFVKKATNVYALVIPKPDHLVDEKYCIEMMYDSDFIKQHVRDEDDRRLFLLSEFDKRTKQHLENPYIYTTTSKTTLVVDDDVFDASQAPAKSLGLSKNSFAEIASRKLTEGTDSGHRKS